MPQLDFLNFFSQLFWLNFFLFVIYFLNVFFFLPIIFCNLRFREEFYLHILEEFSKESIKDLKFEFFSWFLKEWLLNMSSGNVMLVLLVSGEIFEFLLESELLIIKDIFFSEIKKFQEKIELIKVVS
jgi:hypothetical protein